jgi:glycosyltransferase involved in cell wall biosynthesis
MISDENRNRANDDGKERTGVAFVLWTLEGMGGSEKVVYEIARKIDREKFDVIIVAFSDGPVREIYEKIGTRVFTIKKKNKTDFSFVLRLRKIFVQEKIDVINAHHFHPFLYTSIATIGLGIGLVYTEHSRWQLEELPLMKKFINRVLLEKAGAIVAISKQISDYYIHFLKVESGKIHLISNGVDIGLYKKKNSHYFRQKLNIGINEKVVGIIANLRPEKNHKLLIAAFSDVAANIKDVRLVIVGWDCMNGEVQRIASTSSAAEKIIFLGRREDVPDVLSTFDVFCLPSVHEGLPLTLLEAMASGIPVVGSDVLGINEIVKNDVNGMLFPNNDRVALFDLLCSLLKDENLRNRLSNTAFPFVEREFSLDEKVKDYEKLFSSLSRRSRI